MISDSNTHDLAEGTVKHWLATCHPIPPDRLYFLFTPEHLAELGILVKGPVTLEIIYHESGATITGEMLAGIPAYETA